VPRPGRFLGLTKLDHLNQLYKSYKLLRSAFSWMCQHLPSRQASCYHHTLSDELVADQVNDQVNDKQPRHATHQEAEGTGGENEKGGGEGEGK